MSLTMGSSVDEVVDERGIKKADLAKFLSCAINPSSDSSPDVFPFVYSSQALQGYRSGGALWADVVRSDSHYYISNQEAKIFDNNRAYFEQLFTDRPTVCEFGPGDALTLARKTLPLVEAVDAHNYVAIDINPEFASRAAQIVRANKPDISSSFVCGDYTKSHRIELDNTASFGLFLGCSMDQYRITEESRINEITFAQVLKNFGEMLDYNTILMFTKDATTSPSGADDCYSGAQVKAFLRNWLPCVMAFLAADADSANNFILINGKPQIDLNSPPVIPHSRYEPTSRKGGRVVHSLFVCHHITVVINGVPHEITPGTQLNIGTSEKSALPTIRNEIRRFAEDWPVVRTLDTVGSVTPFILAGKGTSEAQRRRVKSQVNELSAGYTSVMGYSNGQPSRTSAVRSTSALYKPAVARTPAPASAA